MVRAIFNGAVLAEADEARVISIEGVTYFPPESVDHTRLTKTETRTACPWRGVATYYTVTVGGRSERDAAFAYHAPKRKGRRLQDYVAFWMSVEVET